MKQIPASLLTLIAGVLITLISLWVGQNHHLLPVQASAQAPLVDGFFDIMVTIGTALFIVVEGAILIFAIRFRRRPGDNTDGDPIEGSVPLEIFWTAIPAIIVIALGTYSVEIYRDMGGFLPPNPSMMAHSHHHGSAIAAPLISDASDASEETDDSGMLMPATPQKAPRIGFGAAPEAENKPADLEVDVLGLQYAWIFTYPESGVTSGELHIPVGKDVQLNISASDVIHSFWVPQFRLKQDALPGEQTQLRFVATRVGDYPVVCAELCGGYHGSMRTRVVVHTPEEYEGWLAENSFAQQQDLQQAVATNPAALSPAEFLAPHTRELGIQPETLAALQLPPS